MAASGNAIDYTPRVPQWREKRDAAPRRYWWQGISEERFDGARGAFVKEIDAELDVKMFSFNEFKATYESAYQGDASAQKPLGLLANALYGFDPESRPVYFRLVTFWFACYSTFLKINDDSKIVTEYPIQIEHLNEMWAPHFDAERQSDVFEATKEYWSDFVRPRLKRCLEGPQETKS